MKIFKSACESIQYYIIQNSVKELYLPYYLCSDVRHSVVKTGCKPIFYHIDDNFMPANTFQKDSYILYPNYFGICSKNVDILEKIYTRLIVDNAHAYYNKPSGIACFDSSKKFIPNTHNSTLYEQPFKEFEFHKIDESALHRRKLFFEYHNKLKSVNLLNIDIKENDIPFCYPCLLKNELEANTLAKELQREGKIIYRYWNPMPKSFNEYKFYSRLVPIPLD